MTPLSINNHYNFSLYATAALGASYENVRLVSVLDYHTAMRFENVVLLHRQVYPYLPSETSEDLTRYTYYLFRSKDKDIVLADVWLIPESVTLSLGTSYHLRLMNISSGQLAVVRDQLKLLGISFSID